MKYYPCITGIDAEYNALKNQNFSQNIIPFIQLVKDKKTAKGKKSILDDYENLIKERDKNHFIVTIPRNINLTKRLKNPVEAFYANVEDDKTFHSRVLNRFSKYSNVTPTIEVKLENYVHGDLEVLKDSINASSGSYCYKVEAKKLDLIFDELSNLVTKNDIVIYNHESKSIHTTSLKKDRKKLLELKRKIPFTFIAQKQVYDKLTFSKYPNGIIISGSEAFDCIDLDFYEDFKSEGFDSFSDWAGIRSLPIYVGGSTYPSYLTIDLETFNHYAYKGTAKQPKTFKTEILKKYSTSEHWTKKLDTSHKIECFGCIQIQNFLNGTEKVNSAMKWKTVTISHFISSMDYKIENSLI